MTPLDAALDYAARGWPVSPWAQRGNDKFPLTDHGHKDATTDAATITAWWDRWPNALVSIATGEASGTVALDIDERPEGSGYHTLEMLLCGLDLLHPETPTAHSPRGGAHLLFAWPGRYIKTVAGALGPHLDIRGDGGSVILPPGPGRYWDAHLGLDTPLAATPDWMVIAEPQAADITPRPIIKQAISRYAEVALDRAVDAITKAPNGVQRNTLNREVYGIANLVAGGVLPSALALDGLLWAARQMPTYGRPWGDVGKLVREAFLDGLHHPRRPEGRQ